MTSTRPSWPIRDDVAKVYVAYITAVPKYHTEQYKLNAVYHKEIITLCGVSNATQCQHCSEKQGTLRQRARLAPRGILVMRDQNKKEDIQIRPKAILPIVQIYSNPKHGIYLLVARRTLQLTNQVPNCQKPQGHQSSNRSSRRNQR